jgi:hypothetical protein
VIVIGKYILGRLVCALSCLCEGGSMVSIQGQSFHAGATAGLDNSGGSWKVIWHNYLL